MKKPMIIMLVVMGILCGGIVAYKVFGNFMMKQYFANMKEPPVTVASYTVTKQSWQPKIASVGTVRSVQGVDITGETAGIVKEVLVVSGETVKAGQVLLRLNTDTDESQLHALKASAALAKINFDRDNKQFEIQAVSQAVLDASDAELKRCTAAVAQQEAVIAKKNISAPFDGRVGVCAVNVGQYLNPGEMIVTLQKLDAVYLDFYLPQQDVSRIAVGQDVTVSCDTAPGRVFAGKVSAVDPKVDAATRNVLVQATVPNEDGVLLSGMFATVDVDAGNLVENLTIPQAAVLFNPYGETVFIVRDKGHDDKGAPILTAVQTFVTTGESRGDQIAVLTGLKENDLIVSSGQHKLRNGSVIVINNSVQPLNEADPKPQDR